MPKYKKIDQDEKLKVIDLHNQGYKPYAIRSKRAEDNYTISEGGVRYIIKQYITGQFNPAHQQVNAHPPTFFQAIGNQEVDTVKQVFEKNHNSSARDVLRELNTNGCNISLSTATRVIDVASFVATKPRYCQLIREANKEARVAFCKELIRMDEQFEDVVFTEESSIRLHYNKPVAYRKKDAMPPNQCRPKHRLKVHLWGGISKWGPTQMLIFRGIMESEFYTNEILKNTLKPFLENVYPDGHRFQQDNYLKHTSILAKKLHGRKQH